MAGGASPPGPPIALVRRLVWLRFFDQHHRNAVDDGIQHFALRAAQVVWLFELDFRVAFRAGKDFEKFRRDHWRMVVRLAP